MNKEQNYHNLHKFSCTHIKIVDQFSRGNINENKTETNTILNFGVNLKKKKRKTVKVLVCYQEATGSRSFKIALNSLNKTRPLRLNDLHI